MKKKYELVKESVIEEEYSGVNLYRIRALKDFCDIKKGDLGGYVESEENLSQDGNCWIYNDAKVYGYAKVSDNAIVSDKVEVYGNAGVYGNAKIRNYVEVCDNVEVCGDAELFDNSRISDNARVHGNASVSDNAKIYGKTDISGDCWISDNARVHGDAEVFGHARIYGCAEVFSKSTVCGRANIHDEALIFGNCIIEDAEICENAYISGNVKIYNGAKIGRNAIIDSSQKYITIGPIDDSSGITTFYLSATKFLFVIHEYLHKGNYKGGIDEFMDYIDKEVDEKYKNVYLAAVNLAKAKLLSIPELKIPSTVDIEDAFNDN